MGSVRLALVLGGLGGATVVGACGLESGGLLDMMDSGGQDVVMTDGGGMDVFMLPDAPMDIMTPDLGTGETESGTPCTCTPPLPGGWIFIAYEPMTRPACSTGYDMAQNTVENIMWTPASCSCTEQAAPTSNPTCDGNVTFSIGFDKSGSCNTVTDNNVVCNGTCNAINKMYSSGGGDFTYFEATGSATATGGTCAAPSPSMSKQPPTYDQGRYCKLKSAPSSCAMGQACVTPPMQGDAICIWKAGIQSCNGTGFPNTHYVGDNVLDTRGCGPDPCNGTKVTFNRGTCTTPQVTLFSDNKCMNGLFSPQTAGSCNNVGLSGNMLNVMGCNYTSTNMNPSCSYTGNFGAIGGVVPTNVQTICCL